MVVFTKARRVGVLWLFVGGKRFASPLQDPETGQGLESKRFA
jgi:hypothetical protein